MKKTKQIRDIFDLFGKAMYFRPAQGTVKGSQLN